MPKPEYKKLSKEEQQKKKAAEISKNIALFQKYVDENYEPTQEMIDAIVYDDAKNEKYFYANFLQSYLDARIAINNKIHINKGNFSRFVALEVEPAEFAPNEEEANKLIEQNDSLIKKYAETSEGRENEKIALHNNLKKVLDFVPESFRDEINGNFDENSIDKIDMFYVVWNRKALTGRFNVNNVYMSPEELKIFGDKYALCERSYFAMSERLYLEASPIFNGFPGIDLMSMPAEDLTNISMKLQSSISDMQFDIAEKKKQGTLSEADLQELKELENFSSEFSELAGNIRQYKMTVDPIKRHADLFDVVKDYITKDGFIGTCYDEKGGTISFEDAFSKAAETNTPFVLAYNGPDKSKLKGAYHIYTQGGKIQAEYYPTLQEAQDAISGVVLDFDEEEERRITPRIKKNRIANIEKTIKDFNKAFGTNEFFKLPADTKDKEKYLADLATDKNKYLISEYAKEFKAYKDELEQIKIYSGKGMPTTLARMSSVLPSAKSEPEPQAVLNSVVSMVKNYDISWIMNCRSDLDLAKKMKENYKQLYILENMENILVDAKTANLRISSGVKTKLLANAALAKNAIQDAFLKMQLFADEQYGLLPDLEGSGITKEKATELVNKMGKMSFEKGVPQFFNTISTYMALQNQIESHRDQLNYSRTILNSSVYEKLLSSKYQFLTCGESTKIINRDTALESLKKGNPFVMYIDHNREGGDKDELFLVEFNTKNQRIDMKELKLYEFFKDVEPDRFDVEEKKEAEEKAKTKYTIENHKTRVRFYIDAVRDKLKPGSPEYEEWTEKYKEIDELTISEEQLKVYNAARNAVSKLNSLSNIQMEGYNPEYYMWLSPALFQLQIDGKGMDEKIVKATNDSVNAHNKEVFEAFKLKAEYIADIEKIKSNPDIPEEGKGEAIFDYFDNKINNPLEMFEDSTKASIQMSQLFQRVKSAMNLEWFDQFADNENDELLIKEWPNKKPLFDLIRQDSFIKDMEKFGVAITPQEKETFLAKKFLITDLINHAQARFDALSQPYYQEMLALDPSGKYLKLIQDSLIMRDKFATYSKQSINKIKNYTRTTGVARRTKEFKAHLEKIGLLPGPDSQLNGKKIYSYDGTLLTQKDALFKMKQSSELTGCIREFAGNDIYIVDEEAKTCMKHSLGKGDGEFKYEKIDYNEYMLSKTEYATKTTVDLSDPNKKINKENLSITENIRSLTRIKESFDNTDFWPFVKNSEKIMNMRASLDNVIKCYQELKPVPLESDMRKLNEALNEFNTNIEAYITYKEHRHKLDDATKYPNGFEAAFMENPRNAGKKLTWREKDRLSGAYELKHLVQNVLKPNIKSDVIQNGLYEQQKRSMISVGNLAPNADVEKRMDHELMELRKARNERISIINYGIKASASEPDGYNKHMFKLAGLDAADNMLTLGYDFDPRAEVPMYTNEVKTKMYHEIAKVLVYNGIALAREKGELKSGEIDLSEKLKEDILRLSESENLLNFVKSENLRPEKILNIVTTFRLQDGEALNASFAKYNGTSIVDELKSLQLHRGFAPNGVQVAPNKNVKAPEKVNAPEEVNKVANAPVNLNNANQKPKENKEEKKPEEKKLEELNAPQIGVLH